MPKDDRENEDDRPRRRRRDEDDLDDYDDAPPPRREKPHKKSGGGEGFATVVPFRNVPALAAYYCGVFGLIPIRCFVLGPIAFILGIFGLVKKKKNPQVHGTGHAIAGIVLGLIDPILWIVLWYTVFDKLIKG